MGKKKSVGQRLVSGLTEFANDLQSDRDSIRDKYTCHRVRLNLQPSAYTPEKIRETRRLLNLSQSIFAEFLGVSVKTVQAWEQGVNQPLPALCRVMDEIRHKPEYWQARLEELLTKEPA